jgi:hypothetical protein
MYLLGGVVVVVIVGVPDVGVVLGGVTTVAVGVPVWGVGCDCCAACGIGGAGRGNCIKSVCSKLFILASCCRVLGSLSFSFASCCTGLGGAVDMLVYIYLHQLC